ncbi:potassium channel subfamily K member 6 [Paramormyrops kingsleyae]|uniref:Potassium channel subfamily K member n=1 Tax=Paramormyrops kingsleyae TaxID=1676925 RepID=A0A3B3RP48_9TELE|nr:potassium channel subfamily K member 6 [Paramormyrops kingsleyae]
MPSSYKSYAVLVGFVLLYILYLVFGALVFSIIERPQEERLKIELKTLKEQFVNQSCVNVTSLENFLVRVLTANKYGVSMLRNASSASNWDFVSSLFFASTLVTTVGYGHTTPLSDAGKAFCIIYALLGVPFTMLVLAVSVQRLMHLLTYKPIALCQRWAGWNPKRAGIWHFLLLLFLVVLCFFAIPSVIFSAIETSWSFLDALYFCFISLCTIGLGDYVPGEQPNQKLRSLYKISVMVYLLVGLTVMFLVLRTFHKLADLHGLTSLLHLPHCEEEEEDKEPIVADQSAPNEQANVDKNTSKPLDPSSQVSYSSINR